MIVNKIEFELMKDVARHYPQFIKFFEDKLMDEYSTLAQTSRESMQVYQGRCLMLKDIILQLNAASNLAKRTV